MASFKYPKIPDVPQSYSALTADDETTAEVEIQDGDFNVAVWGSFIGSVVIEIKPCWRDVTADWIPIKTYTTLGIDAFPQYKGRNLVRARATSFSGGTANVMVYRGEGDSRRYFVTKAPQD